MNPLKRFLFAVVGILFMTIVHHLYGAIIYESPFRLHVVFAAVPVLLILILAYLFLQRRAGSALGTVIYWFFLITALLGPIVAIGIYEGGYNHVVGNILYLAGASEDTFFHVYPYASLYEVPNDFWFEATGVLQFVLGCYAAYLFARLRMEKKAARV